MLGHKASLRTSKATEIIQSIFSNHNEIKLEIKKETWKIHKCLKTKQYISEYSISQKRNHNGNQKIL